MDITIYRCSANEVLDIVKSLRDSGLVQDRDFNFAFTPATWDSFNGDPSIPSSARFTFYDDKWSTWFNLKWASMIKKDL